MPDIFRGIHLDPLQPANSLYGLHAAFTFAILACLVAAAASLLRGGRYQHAEARLPARSRPEEQHAR